MELVGSAEIARMWGVSRQRVHQLAQRPDFPEPAGLVSGRRVWDRDRIERWAQQHDRPTTDT